MGFAQSAALNYFVKQHGQELAKKYGRLPRVNTEDLKKKVVEYLLNGTANKEG